MSPSFHARDGAVYLRRARFEHGQVEELMRLFARERAWDLYDELMMARDVIRYGLMPEPVQAHRCGDPLWGVSKVSLASVAGLPAHVAGATATDTQHSAGKEG